VIKKNPYLHAGKQQTANDQMNRIHTFALLAILLIPGLSTAQEGVKIGLRLSPIIGMANMTDSNKEDIPNLDSKIRLGWSYGLLVDYYFKEHYAFHTGVHIVNKGYRATFSNPSLKERVRVTAVEIPLALKLRSSEIGDGVRLKGTFGLSMDAYVGYRNKYEGNSPFDGTNGDGVNKNTKMLNLAGVSFIYGAGLEFSASDVGTIEVGLSFHQGLNNINNRSKSQRDMLIRANYLALDLGYYF